MPGPHRVYVCFPLCCVGFGPHDFGLVSQHAPGNLGLVIGTCFPFSPTFVSLLHLSLHQKREVLVTLNPRSPTNICRWRHGMETILRSGLKCRSSQLRQDSLAAWEACRCVRASEFDLFSFIPFCSTAARTPSNTGCE